MLGIGQELAVFAQALLAGWEVYWRYTLLRIFRKILPHPTFLISLEDFFYWIGISFFLFGSMLDTSNGSVRWYFILGVVVGAVLPYKTLEKWYKNREKGRKKVVAKMKKKR